MSKVIIDKSELLNLVKKEKKKILEALELKLKHPSDAANATKEITADKFANTLEKCINQYKACQLKEAKLKDTLKKIQEAKSLLKKKIKLIVKD